MMLKRGNHKLSSKIGIWTLPRSTCIGAGECKKWCYARKMENWPNVYNSRHDKLVASKIFQFEDAMVKEIIGRKFSIIRVHESGDFYDQTYLDKWFNIANRCSNVLFFIYTKTFSLLDWSKKPNNIIMFQSYGSRTDDKIDYSQNTARVIENQTELRKTEYLCPYHDPSFKKCGETCSYCMQKGRVLHVCFLKH